jgi:hypothetical protein
VRKTPLKKRVTRSLRPRSNVDPTRVALAALERIRTVLVNSGRQDRLGEPLSMKELATQAQLLGTELPPSYIAAMHVSSKIGDPEVFLTSGEMESDAALIVTDGGDEARRYIPFCRAPDRWVCFDKGGGKRLVSSLRHQGELPIVEWSDGSATPVAAHFGEWLDSIADAREESIESAARMPPNLKRLLYELGFRFEYPVVGRLETGDIDAVVDLIGPELAATIRANVDRLFDSSGKASLTLNVDEFTLATSLRTGIYVFEAEDVFRWLRTFRDENFFSDAVVPPSHPDQVRDLRRAPREPPLVQRGVLQVATLPATNVVVRAVSGKSSSDFYLLARTASTKERAMSLILHVVEGAATAAHRLEEPLNDLHVAQDGSLWGLTTTHAVLVAGGRSQTFPLQRPSHGRPWWYGIGGRGDRVLVWGAGALLEFDGQGFVPFEPDAHLDPNESVIALHALPPVRGPGGLRLSMLVCGDHVGAVARFESQQWEPITDNQVIDASLADLDVWRETAHVLDRDGGVWRIDQGPPRAVPLSSYDEAFLDETGTPRPLYGIRAYDGGILLASNGGVIAVGAGEPLFHAVPNGREPTRLVRVGWRSPVGAAGDSDSAVVALTGPNAWVWQNGTFHVVDLHEW